MSKVDILTFLIKTVRELRTELEKLKTEVETLKKEVEALKSQKTSFSDSNPNPNSSSTDSVGKPALTWMLNEVVTDIAPEKLGEAVMFVEVRRCRGCGRYIYYFITEGKALRKANVSAYIERKCPACGSQVEVLNPFPDLAKKPKALELLRRFISEVGLDGNTL